MLHVYPHQQAVPTVLDFVNLTVALCPALHTSTNTNTSSSNSNTTNSSSSSSKARHMCHYFAEICLQEAALGDTPPSVAAAACVVLALDLLGLLSNNYLSEQLQAVWRWSPLGGSGSVITALQRPLQILYMAHRAMPDLSLQVRCRLFVVVMPTSGCLLLDCCVMASSCCIGRTSLMMLCCEQL
jgi:Cyclin, C-terminal domain